MFNFENIVTAHNSRKDPRNTVRYSQGNSVLILKESSYKIVTTHTPRKNFNKGKVTAALRDEIGGRQRRTTEAYLRYAARSEEAVDRQDRHEGEQLHKILIKVRKSNARHYTSDSR